MFTATLTISQDDFVLAYALREVPEMEITVDRLAAHSRHWVMPCLWTAGGDFDAFDDAVKDDPTVDDIITMFETGNEKFYQMEWSEDIKRHIDFGLDTEGSLLQARTINRDWRLTFRFSTREQFENYRNYLADRGINFHLEELTQASAPQQFMGGMTAAQRDALVTAVDEGYFEIPREATMNEVAERLGISTQAASERLRRGVEEFVTTMLIASEDQIE